MIVWRRGLAVTDLAPDPSRTSGSHVRVAPRPGVPGAMDHLTGAAHGPGRLFLR